MIDLAEIKQILILFFRFKWGWDSGSARREPKPVKPFRAGDGTVQKRHLKNSLDESTQAKKVSRRLTNAALHDVLHDAAVGSVMILDKRGGQGGIMVKGNPIKGSMEEQSERDTMEKPSEEEEMEGGDVEEEEEDEEEDDEEGRAEEDRDECDDEEDEEACNDGAEDEATACVVNIESPGRTSCF